MNNIVPAIVGAITTALLSVIVKMLSSLIREVRSFKGEHLWLLAIAAWTAKSLPEVAAASGVQIDEVPLPHGKHRKASLNDY